jgi:hypothetical protein
MKIPNEPLYIQANTSIYGCATAILLKKDTVFQVITLNENCYSVVKEGEENVETYHKKYFNTISQEEYYTKSKQQSKDRYHNLNTRTILKDYIDTLKKELSQKKNILSKENHQGIYHISLNDKDILSSGLYIREIISKKKFLDDLANEVRILEENVNYFSNQLDLKIKNDV